MREVALPNPPYSKRLARSESFLFLLITFIVYVYTSYIQFELLVEKFNYIYNETNISGALLI